MSPTMRCPVCGSADVLAVKYGDIHFEGWPPPPELQNVIFGGCCIDVDETHGCAHCDARFDEAAATTGSGHVRTAEEPLWDGRPRRRR